MGQKDCLEYLQEHKEATAKDIAEENEFSRRSAHTKLKSLKKSGFVECETSQTPYIYKITEKGMQKDPETMKGMVV